jgi:hypothetical protein
VSRTFLGLNRAGLSHSHGSDRRVRRLVATRAKIAEEDDGSAHYRDDEGHD